MSLDHRTYRAAIYWFVDAGSDGEPDSGYRKQASSASDGNWWCSLGTPTGNDVTVGSKPEERIDGVLGFSIAAPVQAPEGKSAAIIVDGMTFLIDSVLPRKHGTRERQVLARRSLDELKIVT